MQCGGEMVYRKYYSGKIKKECFKYDKKYYIFPTLSGVTIIQRSLEGFKNVVTIVKKFLKIDIP